MDNNLKRACCLSVLLFPSLLYAGNSFLERTKNQAFFKLQQYTNEQSANYESSEYRHASLVNVNPAINRWHLLHITDRKGRRSTYNLLSVDTRLNIHLDKVAPELFLSEDGKNGVNCNIDEEIASIYKKNRRTKFSHVSVCNNQLLAVIKQNGFQPGLEKGAQVLRWLGGDLAEDLINKVKTSYFQDKYMVSGETMTASSGAMDSRKSADLPRADIDNRYVNSTISSRTLGLKTQATETSLLAGKWYPLDNFKGVYTSLILPGMVSGEIQKSHRKRVNRLDSVERKAVVYLMAVNLSQYTLGWGHGTDHPGVGWSKRAIRIRKDNPYGPDGFNSIKPLVPLGHVPPYHWANAIGTFSGGFQNRHSAFKYGELATKNKAHHYGFMENGVMMTSPTVGLATMLMYKDGTVDLKRWEESDKEKLPRIRHFRQNGVPLIHRDEEGKGIPGKWVRFWGPGNWSGSAKAELRTPRGAACLIETPSNNYLVYAYFSGATPSGMARVFQAYGCTAAIHLDMNSPGQAYASLFLPTKDGSSFNIEQLMTDMYQYMGGNKKSPRFLVKPDYKDFFYIMHRDEPLMMAKKADVKEGTTARTDKAQKPSTDAPAEKPAAEKSPQVPTPEVAQKPTAETKPAVAEKKPEKAKIAVAEPAVPKVETKKQNPPIATTEPAKPTNPPVAQATVEEPKKPEPKLPEETTAVVEKANKADSNPKPTVETTATIPEPEKVKPVEAVATTPSAPIKPKPDKPVVTAEAEPPTTAVEPTATESTKPDKPIAEAGPPAKTDVANATPTAKRQSQVADQQVAAAAAPAPTVEKPSITAEAKAPTQKKVETSSGLVVTVEGNADF